jgi:L-ascorbate metabolism protein UlaG (beta-lactamase superfamily)
MYSLGLWEVVLRVTWYGTAGFRIETCGRVLLIDPYLSRGEGARPKLPFGPEGVIEASEIFLSHGHFDHAADVPQIVRQTGARVYCSSEVAAALRRQGVADAQIVEVEGGDVFDFGVYRAQCFGSAHVRFDLGLVARTLLRALPSMVSLMRRLSRLGQWPHGEVLAWRFALAEEDGRVLLHFGSAGWTEEELARLEVLGSPDVLLLPLQGHTRVCEMAARAVARLRPRIVVPHHHDDFFPPISQPVDIEPFVAAVGGLAPPVRVAVLPVGEPAEL